MTKINALWQQYPTLKPELTAVLELMEKHIKTSDRAVNDAILTMIHSGGKLLRPAYCLLFSQFKETDRHKIIALAAAVETLHTATLIHDDVIDRSRLRRNEPTIQATFGQDVAVYAGDYLFVVCFQMLSQYASDLRSIQQNAKGMQHILDGELHQRQMRYNTDMTIDDYLVQIDGKTAQLFALACFIGAFESQNSLLFARNCEQIGTNIGMAFQIMDDILDYTQSEVGLGKPVLEDVRQGVFSAPLLLAKQKNAAAITPYLQNAKTLTDTQLRELRDTVQTVGGVAAAEDLAAQYTQKAIKGLNRLPDQPAKAILLQLTKQLLERKR